jgi:four helix bundle protein
VKSFDLAVRTKTFALGIIHFFEGLPQTVEAQVIGKQILRCGISVGAQYREAKRARFTAEFLSKNTAKANK